MIISQKYGFVYYAAVGHSASTSLYYTLKDLHDFNLVKHDAPTPKPYIRNDYMHVNKHTTRKEALKTLNELMGEDYQMIESLQQWASVRQPTIWWAAQINKNYRHHLEDKNRFDATLLKKYLKGKWVRGSGTKEGIFEQIRSQDNRLPNLIRYEKLQEDFRVFLDKTNLRGIIDHLPHKQMNNAKPINYAEKIDKSFEDMLINLYPNDYAFLGYCRIK